LTAAREPAAAERAFLRAFLRGLDAGGGVEAAALAAPAFDLGGEPGFFDFINDGAREVCHKSETTIAEALPARNHIF
jgi:hypothetical protein